MIWLELSKSSLMFYTKNDFCMVQKPLNLDNHN